MSPSLEIFSLLLYVMQQSGMLLGVGGGVVVMLAYVLAVRDIQIDTKEIAFTHAVKRVMYFGMLCVLLSGVGITLLHIFAHQTAIITSPAYVFKWMLISLLVGMSLAHRKLSLSAGMVEGLSGAAWLALFFLHISAPATSWFFLLAVFVVSMSVFMLCWTLVLYMASGENIFAWVHTFIATKTPSWEEDEEPTPALVAPVVVAQEKEMSLPVQIPSLPPKPALTYQETAAFTRAHAEAFPYTKPVIDPTAMLHPHLTEEFSPDFFPVPPRMPAAAFLIQDAEVTEHLSAVRVMPRSPQDLQTQHKMPLVRFG